MSTSELLYYNAATSLPFLCLVVAATGEAAALPAALAKVSRGSYTPVLLDCCSVLFRRPATALPPATPLARPPALPGQATAAHGATALWSTLIACALMVGHGGC